MIKQSGIAAAVAAVLLLAHAAGAAQLLSCCCRAGARLVTQLAARCRSREPVQRAAEDSPRQV
jgi:hypothetical protein